MQIKSIHEGGDRLIPPARRAKRNIMKVSSKDMAVGNHGSLATEREVQYNLSREAKAKQRDDLKLTNNMLINIVNVTHKFKTLDELQRKSRGDFSKDCLGLVQDSGYHDGFMAVFFTKLSCKVSFSFDKHYTVQTKYSIRCKQQFSSYTMNFVSMDSLCIAMGLVTC